MVTGQGARSPTGTVSFLDTSNGNALLGSAALAQGGTTLSWLNPQSPATGSYPISVAAADFNGDGIPDLAVANSNSDSLTILLGNGDGTFTTTAVSPPTGIYPYFVAVGDFNGDGKADLAVADSSASSLTILLGNGDGTFSPTIANPQTGSVPRAVAVGDFNGDGIQDLAVANSGSTTMTILLGNGDGTFTASAASPQIGSSPQSIALGDFNGDGIQDLAVANAGSDTLTILLGNGDGTFAQAASPSTGSDPVSVAAGDFNGDGKLDLAVANYYGDAATILLGNGDGTFTATAVSPSTGNYPESIATGDFNGDGKADLAVANYYGGTATILLGNGDGTFTSGVSPAGGSYSISMAVADFNGDGIADLVQVNQYSATVTVLTAQLVQTATAIAKGISPVGQGPHLAVASYPGDSDYEASASGLTGLTTQPRSPTVTVTPSSPGISSTSSLTVTVAVNGGTSYPTPTGSVTLTSGNYTSAASTLSGGSTTITIAAGSLAAGSDTLTATYTPDSSSSELYVSATGASSVTVTQVAQTITFANPGAQTVGAPVTLSATASSGLAVSFTSATTSICTVSGSIATFIAPGTCTIDANQAGNAEYSAAPQVAQNIVVNVPTPASLIAPAPGTGTVLGTANVVFQWNAGAGVAEYQLNLSAIAPGDSELFLYKGTATTAIVPNLPENGAIIYATLYSKISGAWQSNAYEYTETSPPAPATITSPTPGPGTVLGTSNVTFHWTSESAIDDYQLNLSAIAAGDSDLYLYKGTATSATVPSLPENGATVYATLYSHINGVWHWNSYLYTETYAPAPATLTSPAPGLGTVLGTTSVVFQWTTGSVVDDYQLNLSAIAPGGSDLYLYKGTATSTVVPALPANGIPVYATLYSHINGVWQSNGYLYTESGTSPGILKSPTPGAGTVLGTTSVAFQWTTGAGVADYQLNLSAIAPGQSELFLYKGTNTSATAPTLPANGATVYATLYSKINGAWMPEAYEYTESGTPAPATLTSPTPGSTTILGTTDVSFQWTAGSDVSAYQLNLSAIAPGGSDLYSYKGTALTATVPTLPANGVTVYATLYSDIKGTWQKNSYVYTESGLPTPAVLTSPTPGLSTILGTTNVLFQWSAGTSASLYQLNLSAIAAGDSDLYLYKGSAFSATAPTLPGNGAKVYARLYSNIDGVWLFNDYVYTEK
ncbi:MAG: FG-GAP-like repeat-containing protein [Terracidiphilus sp.]